MASYTGHGNRTQRDSLYVIATSNPADLEAVVSRWQSLASRAAGARALVEERLAALVSPDGWQGPGAETYAAAVTKEIIDPLKQMEASAKQMAAALTPIRETVATAVSVAVQTPIPWDETRVWTIGQQKLNFLDYAVDTAGKVVTNKIGIDEALSKQRYDAAQAKAPVEIKNGSGQVMQTMSPTEWATTQAQTKPLAAVFHGAVSTDTNNHDVWFEYRGLNTGRHQVVATATDQVEQQLGGFLGGSTTGQEPVVGGQSARTGLGESNVNTFSGLGFASTSPASYDPAGYVAPTGSGIAVPETSTGSPAGTAVPTSPWLTSSSTPVPGLPGVSGTVSAGLPTAGGGAVPAAPSYGMAPAGGMAAGVPSVGGWGTALGGAAIGAAFGGVGFGQAGGAGIASAAVAPSGVGGLSGARPATGTVGASSNPSFKMDGTGRGTAFAGESGTSSSAGGVRGADGQGTGAPLTSRRKGDKESDSELDDDTWLEEDQDVWGLSSSRAEGVID